MAVCEYRLAENNKLIKNKIKCFFINLQYSEKLTIWKGVKQFLFERKNKS